MFVYKLKKLSGLILIIFISYFLISCGEDSDNKNHDSQVKTDVNLDVTYDYDDLNRIKTATYSNGQVVNYIYDASGNILEKRVVR